MNHYIKGLVTRFLENLKKTWLLGAVLLVCAIAFVVFISKDVGEDFIGEDTATTIGVQTVARIEWNFESEEGAAYVTKTQNAKEALDTLYRWVSSGNFYNAVNTKLTEAGLEEMTSEDYFSMAIASYNIVEIMVVGTEADRVEAVEKVIRGEIERFMKEGYGIRSWNVISEPVMLVATPGELGYVLTNQVYVESLETEKQEEVILEDTGNSLFSFSNIVIVLSSVVLWIAIVVLLTIADGRVYAIEELKKVGIICYGEIGANDEMDRNVCSLIKKKVESDKSASIHTLVLDNKESHPVFVQKYEDLYKENVEVSNWKKDAVDKIKKEDTVVLAIKRGEFSQEEIQECLKKLDVVEIKCIGCVLY